MKTQKKEAQRNVSVSAQFFKILKGISTLLHHKKPFGKGDFSGGNFHHLPLKQ